MYDKFGRSRYNDDRLYEQASRYDSYCDPIGRSVSTGGGSSRSPFEINVSHPKNSFHDHYDSRYVWTEDLGIRCETNYQLKVLSVIMDKNPKDAWFQFKEDTIVIPYNRSVISLTGYHKRWRTGNIITFEEYIQKVGYTVMPLKKILI